MAEKLMVVSMANVPDPPSVDRGGRTGAVYQELRKLPLDQSKALAIPCKDVKDLTYARSQLRAKATRDGKVLLTSREPDNSVLYAWLVRKGK